MLVDYIPEKVSQNDESILRIYDFDEAGAQQLKQLFVSLAEGKIEEFVLTDLANVSGIDGCRFVLKVTVQNHEVIRCGTGLSFECQLTHERWRQVAEMTEPFCREIEPGDHYQWLAEGKGIALLLSPNGAW